MIQKSFELKVLTGSYTFNDAEGDSEGTSAFKWYRAENGSGFNETVIANATGSTYAIQAADENKFIRFAVIPVALTGTLQGTEAKATDYAGPVTSVSFSCGSSITISHVAGDVSPVTKNVTYGTVTNIPGEPSKCWITRNLGADRQATKEDDATEASSGWYWQFNRKQGYKYDGTRTPNTWINPIDENLNWQAGNDPCAQTLGSGWRIPTRTEWLNVDEHEEWKKWDDTFDSHLKLHAAGSLNNWNGVLQGRGSEGFYWSSSQGSTSISNFLYFNNAKSYVDEYGKKTSGFSLRCVKGN